MQRHYYVHQHADQWLVRNGDRVIARFESYDEAARAARRMAQQEANVLKIFTSVHIPDYHGAFQPEWSYGTLGAR